MDWLWLFLVTETVLVIVLLHRVRGRSQGIEDCLRDELTRRYDDALKEIRELRDEVDRLWDARGVDRTYIDELEEFVTRLITLMTEHKVTPIPTRPARRKNARAGQVSDKEEARVWGALSDRLDTDDVKTLASDLGFRNLRGDTFEDLVLAVRDYVRTRGRWADLLKWVTDHRGDIEL